MSTEDPASANTKTKHRSPSYPANSLAVCAGWAQRFWDAEKRSATGVAVAVRHCGYNSVSGPSKVALSSMKKFGLLEDDGKERVKLTGDAIRFLMAPHQTKISIAQELAFKCEIVKEFVETYTDGLPSDETLNFELVTERNFGADAAKTFISVLKETIEFAQLNSRGYPGPEVNEVRPSPQSVQSAPAAVQRQARPHAEAGASTLRVEVSTGTVELVASAPLSADTLTELLEYLEVYKRVLAKRARRTDLPADSDESAS